MKLETLWQNAVAVYRESTLLFQRLAAAEGQSYFEFTDFPDAIKRYYECLMETRPSLTESHFSQQRETTLELQDRYNAFLALLNKEIARGTDGRKEREKELFAFHQDQLVNWIEQTILEPNAGLLRVNDDNGQQNAILETANSLVELKPNIAGIGVNLNAIVDRVQAWRKAR